jgi:ribonuclease P protein component
MKRNFRLTRTKDFTRVKKEGKTRHHKFVVLVFIPNNMEYSRAAFIASKAVGNAVTRNLIKRRMKACVANSWSNIKSGWDLVFYARTAGAMASYNDLQEAISVLILKAGLIIDK